MDITRFAIENDRITLLSVALLVIAGGVAFLNLPQAEDPGFTVRTAVIQTQFPGANPERVENLVTDKIEKAIQEMPELDHVRSVSKTGLSVVYADIKDSYKEMRPIWDSLRRKVDSAKPELPSGVIGPVVNDEFGDVFGIIVAVTNGRTADGRPQMGYAALEEIAESARDQLLRLSDTAKVQIYGAQEERVFVEYNDARLAELGLSVTQLQQILESRNIIIPGGSVTTGTDRIELEPSGNFDSVEDLAHTVISVPGRPELLLLEDLAEVRRDYVDPPRSKMGSRGAPALGLAISMKQDGNIVSLGRQVQELVKRWNERYPIGVDFEIVAYQPASVERKVDEFVGNVAQAIAIVLAVMLVMLGMRTGLVVATLVPTAMLASLSIMQALEITLNQMSLAALIIALGMLVDNAIVMSESIMVQMAEGKPRVEAAVDSARELRIPLLTSSLTTAAAFLPIYLAESSTGEYTGVLFTVVTVTLLASWVLALTIIPLLCVLFLKVEPQSDSDAYNTVSYRLYRRVLLGLVRTPVLSLTVVVALFLLSLQGIKLLPNIFFPPSDTPMFTAELELPVGAAVEMSEEIVGRVEDFVERELLVNDERHEGVTGWSSFVGRGAPRFVLPYNPKPPSSEYSILMFNVTSHQAFSDIFPRLEEFCRSELPDVVATIKPLQLGSPIDHPVAVWISGDNAETLFRLADEAKAKLRELPGTRNVGDDWGSRTKKLNVNINEARAQRGGMSHQDIAISLLSGLSGYAATDYREGNKVIPVTLRSAVSDRQDIGKLESMNVYSQITGRSTPLKQVADLEIQWQPSKIYRRDGLKSVQVFADIDSPVTASEITDVLEPWLKERQREWPLGYSWELGGEYRTSGKANQSIVEKAPIGALIIVFLLVGQFNSFRRPLIILLTIPLGMIGVIAGLLITGSYFGFMTLLGVISLAGIVINNAIVLIDRIKIEQDEYGREPARAIVEAAQRRLRPIVLTTMTTIGGLVPLWLGGGPMWEPMAIAIIFGLFFATVLTLGVVPALYALFFRVSFARFRY
ncbi:MAG: MMPL family transporter [Acidobacteria bacterium]|nr:MMPL family transporter [Acidobacteriota bacterium]